MKSKIEQKLDAEFEKRGVIPHIYHFTGENVEPYRAITVALKEPQRYEVVQDGVIGLVGRSLCRHPRYRVAFLLRYMHGMAGIAICNRRDNFDRRKGRVIAKGRLLKHLKEDNKER